MNIFFDVIIFGFLFFDIPFVLWYIKKRKPNLPRKKALPLLALAFIAWGIIFYGSFIAPKQIIVQQESINLIQEPTDSLSIALLSDFHVGPYKDEAFLEKIVKITIEQKPDYVFLLGDYIYESIEDIEKLSPLQELTKTITTYGIMGNHDYHLSGSTDDIDDELAQAIRTKLTNLGVILMEDESRPIDPDKLWITGSQEIWTNRSDLTKALSNRANPEIPTILLVHNPDLIREVTEYTKVDLVISGHTHGGQIRLPLLGPIGPIPNALGQKYDQGFFDYNGTKLYITSGLGESGPRARLFNPPEVVMMEVEY